MKSLKNRPALPPPLEGYTLLRSIDMQHDKKLLVRINVLSAGMMLGMAVLGLFLYRPEGVVRLAPVLLLQTLIVLAELITYIYLHEWIHGLFMKRFSGVRPRYGFTGLFAYAGSDAFFTKKQYAIIALAPVALLGALLALACALLPGRLFWFPYIVQIMNVSGAAGDLYEMALLARMPSDLLVWDEGTRMAFLRKATARSTHRRMRFTGAMDERKNRRALCVPVLFALCPLVIRT